jgi:hypothetical protein
MASLIMIFHLDNIQSIIRAFESRKQVCTIIHVIFHFRIFLSQMRMILISPCSSLLAIRSPRQAIQSVGFESLPARVYNDTISLADSLAFLLALTNTDPFAEHNVSLYSTIPYEVMTRRIPMDSRMDNIAVRSPAKAPQRAFDLSQRFSEVLPL